MSNASRVDQIAIVDATLIPTRDHRVAAQSEEYRYSINSQVAIDARPGWSSRSTAPAR
jgi:hypothetical protein